VARDVSAFDLREIVSRTQAFSGAEIEQSVVSALYDAFDRGADLGTEGLLRSVGEMVPLAFTMKEKIDGMRDWAGGRARRASPAVDQAPEIPVSRLEI